MNETRENPLIEWMFRHPLLTFVLVGSLIGFLINAADGDLSNGGGGYKSSRSICEDLWDENYPSAESPYMTRSRYISNCMETNDDIINGRFGN